MSNDETRRISLTRLLGIGQPPTLAKALEDLQAALVAEGHEVKSYDGKAEKGIVEDLQEQLRGMLEPLSENIPDDLINTIIASVMGALAQMPADEEEEPMPEAPPAEVEVMADEEEEEEEVEQPMTMGLVKQMLDDNNAMFEEVKALVQLVPSFIAMADAVKELAPTLQIAPRIDALEATMKSINETLSMTPRIASKDDATVTESKEAADEIAKSTDDYDMVFGIPVKKI
jgi:hypothetical protein